MKAIDNVLKKNILQNSIDRIVAETLNPQNNIIVQFWNSMGKPLTKGLLSSQNFYNQISQAADEFKKAKSEGSEYSRLHKYVAEGCEGFKKAQEGTINFLNSQQSLFEFKSENIGSYVSIGLRIMAMLNGIKEIWQITDKIQYELLRKLSYLNEENFSPENLLHENFPTLEKNKVVPIIKKLREQNVFQKVACSDFSYEEINRNNLERSNLLSYIDQKQSTEIKKFFKNIADEEYVVEFDEFSKIKKSINQAVTDHIMRIIESQLISPISSMAVGKIVDYASGFIQDKLVNEKEDSIDQKSANESVKALKDKKAKGEKLSEDEEKFINHHESKFRTFADQIHGNANDYMASFAILAQRQIASEKQSTTSKNDGEKLNETSQKIVDNARKGGDAGVIEKEILQNDLDGSTVVVQISEEYFNDPKLRQQILDNNKGKNIKIYTMQNGAFTGHEVLLLPDNTVYDPAVDLIKGNIGEMDCSYVIHLKLKGLPVNKENIAKLRDSVASKIENNASHYNRLEKQRQFAQKYFPIESQRYDLRSGNPPAIIKGGLDLAALLVPLTVDLRLQLLILSDKITVLVDGLRINSENHGKLLSVSDSINQSFPANWDNTENLKEHFKKHNDNPKKPYDFQGLTMDQYKKLSY